MAHEKRQETEVRRELATGAFRQEAMNQRNGKSARSRLTSGMFSSLSDEWETPQDFFDELDRAYHFTLDICATPSNANRIQRLKALGNAVVPAQIFPIFAAIAKIEIDS